MRLEGVVLDQISLLQGSLLRQGAPERNTWDLTKDQRLDLARVYLCVCVCTLVSSLLLDNPNLRGSNLLTVVIISSLLLGWVQRRSHKVKRSFI